MSTSGAVHCMSPLLTRTRGERRFQHEPAETKLTQCGHARPRPSSGPGSSLHFGRSISCRRAPGADPAPAPSAAPPTKLALDGASAPFGPLGPAPRRYGLRFTGLISAPLPSALPPRSQASAVALRAGLRRQISRLLCRSFVSTPWAGIRDRRRSRVDSARGEGVRGEGNRSDVHGIQSRCRRNGNAQVGQTADRSAGFRTTSRLG